VTLAFVAWSGAVIFSLVALIACQLIVVRMVAATRRTRQQRLERVWLPLLLQGMERVPELLPRLRPRDVLSVLILWNRLHEAIKVSSNESLRRMAVQIGLDHAARRSFSHTKVRNRLLAIATLGRLGDRAKWSDLTRLATTRDLALSLAAAHAMIRIDPRSATTLLLPLVGQRDDWPPSTVALMLQDAGADVISEPLVKAVQRSRPERAHRLIRYLGLTHAEVANPLLHRLIREVESTESITACLRVFTDASDTSAVRPFLHHARWEVRVRAVEALGRLGTAQDEESLIVMLSDFEWWVRYRAAQALCRLQSGDLERVRRLKATHSDPFARDILTHVIAEQAAA
jgi:HEAT repeat protein